MTDYTITTNFGAKDSLPSGNAGKVIKGSEFTTEFTNIATAVNTKADTAGDTFTGVVNFSDDVAVNTNTLFVDASTGKVGIGTTSPSTKLHIDSGATDEVLRLEGTGSPYLSFYDTGVRQSYIGSIGNTLEIHGDTPDTNIALYTANTERLRIDSSGNIGIGTTSPSEKLVVKSGTYASNQSGGMALQMGDESGNHWKARFKIKSDGSGVPRTVISGVSNASGGSIDAINISNTGNVGIGTTSPDGKLDIEGDFEATKALVLTNTKGTGKVSYIRSHGADGEGLSLYHDGQRRQVWDSRGYIAFEGTDGAEDMRIDSSGNVLVNTTSSDPAFANVEGIALSTNFIASSRTSNPALFLNRKSTDGTIAEFKKDGTTVGAIGTASGGITFASGSTITERMRIDSSGNVGIGNNNPSVKLQVAGDAIFDGGTSTTVTIKCDDTGNAVLNVMGDNQGTGVVFVGQAGNYGGGIEYNGDSSPATSGAGDDVIALFRRNDGTDAWTAKNGYSNNTWQFRGTVTQNASDERLKENITPIENALEKVEQLRGVTFDWKDDVEEKGFVPYAKHETGVIAQDVQKVLPDAAVPAPFDENYLTVQHEKIIPLLIESIKELIKEVQSLRSRVAELESE